MVLLFLLCEVLVVVYLLEEVFLDVLKIIIEGLLMVIL